MPKVSVIMSVYNGEKYLAEAIESILGQSFRDFEFIIIDDASRDDSHKIIEKYKNNDARIILLKNEQNLGLTKSLNIAIQKAKGDYIARMDADDISLENRFAEQVDFLEKNKDIKAVSSDVLIIDGNGNKIKKVVIKNLKNIYKKNCLVHGSVLFDKNIFEEIGLYNEDFKYAQDYELFLRILTKYKIENLSNILYKLRFSDDRLSTKKMFSQMYFTSLAKFNIKNKNRGVVYKRFGLVWENFYSFVFIYKLGLGELLRKLKIIS